MDILVYSTDWCSDCVRSKALLKREKLPFNEIDIEEVDGAEEAMKTLNGGSRKIPTILIQSEQGRDILIEPTDPELLAVLQRHKTLS